MEEEKINITEYNVSIIIARIFGLALCLASGACAVAQFITLCDSAVAAEVLFFGVLFALASVFGAFFAWRVA